MHTNLNLTLPRKNQNSTKSTQIPQEIKLNQIHSTSITNKWKKKSFRNNKKESKNNVSINNNKKKNNETMESDWQRSMDLSISRRDSWELWRLKYQRQRHSEATDPLQSFYYYSRVTSTHMASVMALLKRCVLVGWRKSAYSRFYRF